MRYRGWRHLPFYGQPSEPQQTQLTDHMSLLRRSNRTVKQCHPFGIDKMIMLPDHIHAI